VLTQIYGITNVEDALLVAEAGADHLGIVLAQGAGTWDEVDEPTARAIFDAVRGRLVTVCMLFDHEVDPLMAAVASLQPDIVHLVRWVEEYPPGKLTLQRSAIPDTKVMVSVPVTGPESIETARRFDGAADFLLLDTVHPETGIMGASGHVHDWSISRAIVDAVEHPVFLAGGLGPDNVVDAIEQVRPAGVDSETHTSRTDDRRRKDPDRVRAFVEKARV
jgi:phosphoribosylanthranilate isomerase